MKKQKWNKGFLFWEEFSAFGIGNDVPDQAVKVDLPHDAMALRKRCSTSQNGLTTGYQDGGVYHYEKVYIPDPGETAHILYIEGAYANSMVSVNGSRVGGCAYGLTSFSVCLDDYLRPDAENRIRISVCDKGMPNCRYYSGSGLFRDLYLYTGRNVYVLPQGTKISTLWIDEGMACLEISSCLKKESPGCEKVELSYVIVGPEGDIAAEKKQELTLPGKGESTISEKIYLKEPRLWSDETPELYRLELTISGQDGGYDHVTECFGVRTLRLVPGKGLLVNGRHVVLRGAAIHHDNGLLGAVSLYDAEYRKVSLLKKAGFNALRMAHNPASPTLLQVCDELGMYVYEEAFDAWTVPKMSCDFTRSFHREWEMVLEEMVKKDFNHPSVIIYGIGNEIQEVTREGGVLQNRAMVRKLKSLDSSRPVTNAVNGTFAADHALGMIVGEIMAGSGETRKSDMGQGDVNDFMTALDTHWNKIVSHPLIGEETKEVFGDLDVAGYNYMTGRYRIDKKQFPDRMILGSETYPPAFGENWAMMKECPNVIGDFTWTGWDYLGEAGVGVPGYDGKGGFSKPYPCFLAGVGDLDITGFRNPASYYREIVMGLRKDPYLCVQNPEKYGHTVEKTPWILTDAVASYDWKGWEGKPANVELFAPEGTVELYQNGEKVAVLNIAGPAADICAAPEDCKESDKETEIKQQASASEYYRSAAEITYQPGILTAVSYDRDGEKLGEMSLQTPGSKTALCVEKTYEGRELIYYDLCLRDERGIPASGSEARIRVKIEGPALVTGLGSASPYIDEEAETCKNEICHTWHGRAQLILRKVAGEGEIRVTADIEAVDSREYLHDVECRQVL